MMRSVSKNRSGSRESRSILINQRNHSSINFIGDTIQSDKNKYTTEATKLQGQGRLEISKKRPTQKLTSNKFELRSNLSNSASKSKNKGSISARNRPETVLQFNNAPFTDLTEESGSFDTE